jgi:hypothetical protein
MIEECVVCLMLSLLPWRVPVADSTHLIQRSSPPVSFRGQQRGRKAQRHAATQQRPQARGGAGEQGVDARPATDASCSEKGGKRLLGALQIRWRHRHEQAQQPQASAHARTSRLPMMFYE